jgi:hypothetical protein
MQLICAMGMALQYTLLLPLLTSQSLMQKRAEYRGEFKNKEIG